MELIVVIGLILFIASVFIFPAFERVRGKATEVVCVSNLRQIGQALLMYGQDHDELAPPYCGVSEKLELTSLKAKRWRDAFEPYVKDNGIFFCPEDPFAGLPPSKTPCQGLPANDPLDCVYAGILDHSVTSYFCCPGVMAGEEGLDIEDWFKAGYYPVTDPYQNMANFPRKWLEDKEDWLKRATSLHQVAVYMEDEIHYLPEGFVKRYRIELFFDGQVELHLGVHRPCSIWKGLVEYFKQYEEGNEK